MSQAIVDPEELRSFARNLRRFNNELRERANSLANQLTTLGASWRDQEHAKFSEQFQEHMKVIARFSEATEEYIPYLVRKAEYIEQYQQS
ncbi:MAG: WXG100 family type VII secretion target [Planctomycetales bacterium]|nr:WXG100 family type VII secretion target [Planctomycetales bacterium]